MEHVVYPGTSIPTLRTVQTMSNRCSVHEIFAGIETLDGQIHAKRSF